MHLDSHILLVADNTRSPTLFALSLVRQFLPLLPRSLFYSEALGTTSSSSVGPTSQLRILERTRSFLRWFLLSVLARASRRVRRMITITGVMAATARRVMGAARVRAESYEEEDDGRGMKKGTGRDIVSVLCESFPCVSCRHVATNENLFSLYVRQ